MKRFFKFTAVSCVGFCIDYVLTLSFLNYAIPAALSLAISMGFSATVVYFLHHYFTFGVGKYDQPRLSRLTMFLVSSLVVYLFRLAFFQGLRFVGAGLEFSLLVALASSLIVNYSISRLVIFGKGKYGPH